MAWTECVACLIRDCPTHCHGCGYPVAHNRDSCLNEVYRMTAGSS